MIRFRDAVDQIVAVWDLVAGDRDSVQRIDRSVDGVLRSFWAVAFTLPLALCLYAFAWPAQQNLRAAGDSATPLPPLPDLSFSIYMAVQTISLFAAWAASLVLLAALSRSFQQSDKAGLAIVAYNWSQIVLVGVQLAFFAIIAAFPNPGFALALGLASYGVIIFVYWGLVRRTLDRDIGVSLAIIAMLTLVQITVTAFVGAIVAGVAGLFT
ncbi:MAG: hypothetical protein AAF224_07335 [Pseudomonadota bacterium]